MTRRRSGRSDHARFLFSGSEHYCFSKTSTSVNGLPAGDVPFATIRIVLPSELTVMCSVETTLPPRMVVTLRVLALICLTLSVLPSEGPPSRNLTGPPPAGCVRCVAMGFPLPSVPDTVTSVTPLPSVNVTVVSLGAGPDSYFDLAGLSFQVPENESAAYRALANPSAE